MDKIGYEIFWGRSVGVCYGKAAGELATDWRSQERLSRGRNSEADLSWPAGSSPGGKEQKTEDRQKTQEGNKHAENYLGVGGGWPDRADSTRRKPAAPKGPLLSTLGIQIASCKGGGEAVQPLASSPLH